MLDVPVDTAQGDVDAGTDFNRVALARAVPCLVDMELVAIAIEGEGGTMSCRKIVASVNKIVDQVGLSRAIWLIVEDWVHKPEADGLALPVLLTGNWGAV